MAHADPYPKRWLFFPPFLFGLAILIGSIALSGGAEHGAEQERSVPVRALTVTTRDLVPVLIGHGEARPEQVWQAVAQVPGRIAERNPALRDGAVVPAGTVLVTIDPHDYSLALRRAEAQLAAARAELTELEVRHRNLGASVAIESRALTLAEAELERRRLLGAQGHLSRLEVDAEEQRMLRQQQNLQSMRSQLDLVPTQREGLRAREAEAAVAVARAEEDLVRTRIVAPFDGRVRDVRIDTGQFVATAQSMFALESTSAVEVVVHAPVEQLINRFPDVAGASADALDALGVIVTYRDRDLVLRWPGRVVRVDPAVDPHTRAATVFVRVDNADAALPLSGYLYVEVEIRGPALPDRIVIPRLAVHEGEVFVIDAEQRLRRVPVIVDFRQDDVAVVRDGLHPGDRVIQSDLPYPVDGMRVHEVDAEPGVASAGTDPATP
jgi:RND family efflux transporter MFP subunit